ncbi:MAG: hypothetical protein EB071_11790 [Gammaproteobacteria bacterium]|nr:hypothetical protein [Gammaproteobacteria bacterium]
MKCFPINAVPSRLDLRPHKLFSVEDLVHAFPESFAKATKSTPPRCHTFKLGENFAENQRSAA